MPTSAPGHDVRALISPSYHTYERLSDVGSGGASPAARFAPHQTAPFGDAAGSDSDDNDFLNPNRRKQTQSFFQRIKTFGQRAQPPVQSNYLTLIPLSDDRLKPRHTALLVSCLLLLAVALASGVFVVVPRGVTIGSIQVRSSRMSFNTSKSTYQIILTATIPIFNPNYLPVRVSGSLLVSFYDQQAGLTQLEPMEIRARAFPEVSEVDMDASSVPQKYLFTIYTQCFTFPERIIFFLTGKLQSKFLGWTFSIPDIDSYFIVPCTNAPDKDVPDPPKPMKPPHAPLAPPKPPRPPRPPLFGGKDGDEAQEGQHGGGRSGDGSGAGTGQEGRGGGGASLKSAEQAAAGQHEWGAEAGVEVDLEAQGKAQGKAQGYGGWRSDDWAAAGQEQGQGQEERDGQGA